MTSHDEILERMSGANPLPDVGMITDGQLAEMTLQLEEGRRAGRVPDAPQELRPTRTRVRWMRPAVAFAAAVLVAFAVIGAVSLTTGGESDVADQTSSTAPTETTSPSTTSTFELPPAEWNPVLATVVAGAAPEPAVCPAGTDPTAAGPADQDRPAVGSPGLLSAAFDRHAGRVLYVDRAGATWAFDVCTNTWTDLHPSGAVTGNISGGLVYDIDSDLTVSIEPDEIFVYDAGGNTWEVRANTSSSARGPVGAVYDPVSGLIVTSSPSSDGLDPDDWMVQAYDVDADEWHDLGVVSVERETPCCTGIDLLGYSTELDRLILTTYVDEDEATLLLDLRTGAMTVHATPTPVVNLAWPSHSYGQGDTVYVHTADRVVDGRWTDVLCGFDPTAIAWTRCYTAPAQFPALKHDNFDAIVGDPINNRLLLIGSTYYASVPRGIDDVWAIDLETGEWIEVVAATDMPAPAAPEQVPYEWSPLLATQRAQVAPEPATCPGSSDPNVPGPIAQERPTTVEDDHDGAFDRRTGRVIYVDTMQRTWAFDVCTNTWHNLEPEGIPVDASLVYDIDSDVTIALGPGDFSVYDAAGNTWTRPATEVSGGPAPESFWGVAYDPVSGLVITSSGDQLWAFDVESNRLTLVGVLPPGQLAGYVPGIDRLLWAADSTLLLDPRSGEITPAGELPFVGWGMYDFFAAAGTVFIGEGDAEACGFNSTTLAWDWCFDELSPKLGAFASRVEDPINDRVILIHRSDMLRDVWSLDLQTGAMHQALAPGT